MSPFMSQLTERFDVDMESLLAGQRQDQNEEEDGDSIFMCPSLSWQERLGGCLGCMVLGYVLSFGSFFRFKDLLQGDPRPFVVYSTLGNIISLSGSFFISGPKSQLKKMFHDSRKVATMLYLGSLLVTLAIAFIPFGAKFQGVKAFILVTLLIFQYIAVGWYCLSYIPFARQITTRAMNTIWSRIEDWD
jgi:hypothetical protein